MKNYIFGFISAIVMLVSTSCLTNKNQGVFGNASKKEDKAKSKIDSFDRTTTEINNDRLNSIGAFAYGVSYAIKKIPPTLEMDEIKIAYTLNERVQSLANKPDLNAINEMKKIVDEMTTNNLTSLKRKDKEILNLQISMDDAIKGREKAIQNYIALADATAHQTDQYKKTLTDMDSFFGIGAIWYGLKKMFVSSMWTLIIGSVLFLLLRLLASSNPIAASIFKVFELIGSWFVHMIQAMLPKSVNMAGNVSRKLFSSYQSTLLKLIDSVQIVRDRAKASGKEPTISDFLDEAGKTMNDDEKAIIEELKKSLNWK